MVGELSVNNVILNYGTYTKENIIQKLLTIHPLYTKVKLSSTPEKLAEETLNEFIDSYLKPLIEKSK